MSGRGPTRVGLIVPSSNIAVESALAARALPPDTVAVHVSRVRVTTVSLEPEATEQFDVGPMRAAAALLADARPDAVMWAGTAGSWLGLDHDRALVDALAEATGVPAGTSTLALLEACRAVGADRVALVTPYTGAVVERIRQTYAGAGIAVVGESHLDISDNHAFGLVGPDQIRDLVRACDPVGAGARAVVVACTNLGATGLVQGLEEELGMPVLDSIAVTLWQALVLAGSPHAGRPSRPGPGHGLDSAMACGPAAGGAR